MKSTKTALLILIVISMITSCTQPSDSTRSSSNQSQLTNLVDYANPLMGTDSEFSLSNGNTYPAIAQPWV